MAIFMPHPIFRHRLWKMKNRDVSQRVSSARDSISIPIATFEQNSGGVLKTWTAVTIQSPKSASETPLNQDFRGTCDKTDKSRKLLICLLLEAHASLCELRRA